MKVLKVVRAQVVVGLTAFQNIVANDEQTVTDRNQSPLLAPPAYQSVVLRGQIGVLGVGRSMSGFDQGAAEPAVALARFATFAVAPTFVVPWTHPRPGGQMMSIGKTAHVGPDLGDQFF